MATWKEHHMVSQKLFHFISYEKWILDKGDKQVKSFVDSTHPIIFLSDLSSFCDESNSLFFFYRMAYILLVYEFILLLKNAHFWVILLNPLKKKEIGYQLIARLG